MTSLPENIILVDKPSGMTSFDVIRNLRKQTGIRKFGHAGTLDPNATGLLIIGYNQGTKLLTNYIKQDKEYEAVIRLGESRTTSDMDGEITDQLTPVDSTEDMVKKAVTNMKGELTLPVSPYSAIKIDGEALYKKAYRGGLTSIEIPKRCMQIYEANYTALEMTATGMMHISVTFKVASGVYIRSLAEELGRRLGYPACLYSLRRTKVGELSINSAYPLEHYQKLPI